MAKEENSRSIPLVLLGIARLGVGVSSWLLPRQACQIFALMTIPPSSNIIMRLFGIRDATLATLLLGAQHRSEQRRLLAAGAIVDTVDILACAVGFISGDMGKPSALFFAAEASSLVLLAAWAWQCLPEKRVQI
jgi:hypothetical protein